MVLVKQQTQINVAGQRVWKHILSVLVYMCVYACDCMCMIHIYHTYIRSYINDRVVFHITEGKTEGSANGLKTNGYYFGSW